MESRFDVLAKALAGGVSRREALRQVGASVAAAALATFGIGCEDAPTGLERGAPGRPLLDARGRCKRNAQKCRIDSECCSGYCNPSTGKCACGPGTSLCSATGICVACDSSATFDAPSCTCRCPTDTVVCGTTCVNTSGDEYNCGACGQACASGETCVNGVCSGPSCPSGQTLCNGTCVNTSSDNNNCGACGQACASGETCVSGVCTAGCDYPLILCNGVCTSLSTRNNCGTCGNVCASNQFCGEEGVCINCTVGWLPCNDGFCSAVSGDENNCGTCGNVCASGACQNGVCAAG